VGDLDDLTTSAVPNPGSDDAVQLGCTCPVMDNARGRGIPFKGEGAFWINDACPLHGSLALSHPAPPPPSEEI
jgi:hypothetical protein